MEPKLDAIGIVAADIAASAAFYRLLGVPFGEPAEGEDHFEATLPSGLRLMLDSEALVRQIKPGWTPPNGQRIGLAFLCASPEDVDRVHQAVVDAGHASELAPWDAFWGQRYAQVKDPDGNTVDLFAPLPG
ncbi:MAG: VOC family protein [Fimbriimonadaceae bacterium]|nr:VOC family protein [Chthonomonadaceae bacterium]MCO5296530.1 VOC family protein [Fimbriimonadaceae bacterium]